MINVKISVDNERLFEAAKTEEELRGAVDLILERINQAKVTKEFKKEPEKGSPYNWKKVIATLRETLGDDLRVPPFPDSTWYQSVYRYAKMYGLEGETLTKLAQKVITDTYLKPPYSAEFLCRSAQRILDGVFDKGREKPSSTFAKKAASAPLPSLPED